MWARWRQAHNLAVYSELIRDDALGCVGGAMFACWHGAGYLYPNIRSSDKMPPPLRTRTSKVKIQKAR